MDYLGGNITGDSHDESYPFTFTNLSCIVTYHSLALIWIVLTIELSFIKKVI